MRQQRVIWKHGPKADIYRNDVYIVLATKETDMKRYLAFIVLAVLTVLFACSSRAKVESEIYQTIRTKAVFSELITRDNDDRVYSGQIKSEAGLREFEKTYGVQLDDLKVNFKKQMLIFGITDEISTRVFQFLKQKKIRSIILDYAETGIKYKLVMPDEGKKHSYVQVFILKRIEAISHIKVKNLVRNGLSKVYDE